MYLLDPPPLVLAVGCPIDPTEFPPELDEGEGLVDEDAATATAAATAGVADPAQKSCPAAAAEAAALNPLNKDSV